MAAAPERGPSGEIEKVPHFVVEPEVNEPQAWEELEKGRYMPRRIRGSFRGRALG